ncbi:hypothetical protein EMCRGX_G016778 [Ephydatia muelleri]
MGSVDLPSSSGPNSGPIPTRDLVLFKDVFKLKCATIRHIPAKARPIFAKVLSAALREVLNKNTQEAWLNLFMLPKCVLLPSSRKGRHHQNSSIISLCKLWLKSEFQALWRHVTNYSVSNKTKTSKQFDVLNSAIALAREGSLGKACQAKAAEYFEGYQTGVACPGGSEIIVHGLRDCIEKHWNDEDVVTLKIDFQNAFNIVSRQALLEECHAHFPELLPWASWCYGQHPMLFHPMGTISSETGVQQGDPLGPLFFCLVLHKLVATIVSDEEASHLLYHKWYMDDGVVAGTGNAVARVIAIIKEQGPHLGLFIKDSNYELFSTCNLNSFPLQMKRSNTANLVLLGAPIGDLIFCAKFISSLRSKISDLLSRLQQIGPKDPQVAYRLSVATLLWQLLQIGIALGENHHLEQSIDDLNHIIGVSEAVSVQDILDAPPRQRNLSSKIEDHQLRMLFDLASTACPSTICVIPPRFSLALSHAHTLCSSTYTWNRLNSRWLLNGGLEWTPPKMPAVPFGPLLLHQSQDQAKVAMIQQVDRKLLFIPIVFILLRIWGTLEFIFTEVYSKYFCTNSPAFLGVLSALRFLQAIGDGGQGWSNAILYIFNSPKIRNLLLKDLTTCCSRTANILNDCRNQMKVKTKDYEATTTSEFVRISVPDESHVEFGSSEH